MRIPEIANLFLDRENWILERILHYAQKHGYVPEAASLIDAWRISIPGLNHTISSFFEDKKYNVDQKDIGDDLGLNEIKFCKMVARRHRERGVSIGMFLGLFTYYRLSYQDCIREFYPPSAERDAVELALVRLFDSIGAAICSDWVGNDKNISEFNAPSEQNTFINDTSQYLQLFENIDIPVLLIGNDGRIRSLNLSAMKFLKKYYHNKQKNGLVSNDFEFDNIRGKLAIDFFPWLEEYLSHCANSYCEVKKFTINIKNCDYDCCFRVEIQPQSDMTGNFLGYSILLNSKIDSPRNMDIISHVKEELEIAFDTISDLVFLVNDSGILLRVNKALADKLSVKPSELIGKSCEEMLGCSQCALFEDNREAQEVLTSYSKIPGRFMVRSNPLVDSSGTYIGKVVVSRDVTPLEKIQRTLQSIETKYKNIFNHAPIGIFQSTEDGRYLSVNLTLAAMLGFVSTEDMILYYHDIGAQMYVDSQARAQIFEDGLKNGVVSAREVQLIRRDGSFFWGRLGGRLVKDGSSGFSYFEGFVDDVTASRAARLKLSQSESQFRSLAEHMEEGLVQTNCAGIVEYCNDYFCRVVNKNRSDIIFKSLFELIHSDDLNVLRSVFNKENKILTNDRLELRFFLNDTVCFTLVTPLVLKIEGKEGVDYWFLIMDITERKMLESQLLQTQKLEAVGQLAAGVAHEINTPTQYVLNNMWFIKEGMEQMSNALNSYREYVETFCGAENRKVMIKKEEEFQLPFYIAELPAAISETLQGLDRISAIVNSVKQFAHPGYSEHQEVDLNDLIEKTATLSRNEWKYHAEMTLELDPELPQVVCSSQGIGQVLLNLVINAAHAIADAVTEEVSLGHITIRTRRIGDNVEIQLQDSGTGIPAQAQAHVFEPFFTTKEVGKGTGQGLFIAHRVVVGEHGGKIGFQTEPGRGTLFSIVLPVVGKNGGMKHG